MTQRNTPRHRTSTPVPIYPCDLCGTEFLDYNQMRKHRLECTGRKSRDGARGASLYGRTGQPMFTPDRYGCTYVSDRYANQGLRMWLCDKCGKKWGPCLLAFNRQRCLFCGGNLNVIESA